MGSPFEVVLVPLKYPERFKWGYFQKVRLFLCNSLLDEAIIVRGLELDRQLPNYVAWHGTCRGHLAFLEQQNVYLHHTLAPRDTDPVFYAGLILPGSKMRLTVGMRMHNEEQRLRLSMHRVPMSFVREKVFFRQPSQHPTVKRYGLLDKNREREYASESSLPDHFQSRRVIITDNEQLSLEKHEIELTLELGNLREKARIEKVLEGKQDSLYYYYCDPLNQWFIQDGNQNLVIKKVQGKLCPAAMPACDFRVFDAIEDNPQMEAIVRVAPEFASVLQHYGIDVQGKYAYIGAKSLLDALAVMKLHGNRLDLCAQDGDRPGVVFAMQSGKDS